MSWFKRAPRSGLQEMHVPRIAFLGEQDGAVEKELKKRLIQLFDVDRRVLAAYLARLDVGGRTSVALCLRIQSDLDRGLAEAIGAIFKAMFNPQTHLDIISLSASQEVELGGVCRAFYRVEGSS